MATRQGNGSRLTLSAFRVAPAEPRAQASGPVIKHQGGHGIPCPYIPDSGHFASGVRDFDVGASSQRPQVSAKRPPSPTQLPSQIRTHDAVPSLASRAVRRKQAVP